jgi:sugar O-acyltransferase (sialic acid O-acetyltransferase NeuD family)
MKENYLLACGGHGRVVLDSLLLQGIEIKGILDTNLEPGARIFGVPVIGHDDHLKTVDPLKTNIIIGLGFINNSLALRKDKHDMYIQLGFSILGTQHPSVIIGRETIIEPDAQIMAGAVLQNRTSVGSNTVINTRVSVDHDCQIGKHCYISPGVILCGGITIADEAFIGAGSTILPGVSLPNNAFVPAGTLVTKQNALKYHP